MKMDFSKINRDIEAGELEPFRMKYEEVKRWLRKVESERTKYSYTKNLMRYCETTNLNPYELIELKKNSKDHDAEDVLDQFVEDGQKATSNSMIWNVVIAIKSFYRWNYQDLSRGAGKITLEKKRPYRTPDRENLTKFLEGSHVRDKALIALFSSTGISIGSIPDLKWSHVWTDLIEKKMDVPHIGLRSTEIKGKGKGKYENIEQHTFLTPFASKALLSYKEWRERKEGKQLTPNDWLFADITEPYAKIGRSNIERIFLQRGKDTGIMFSPHDMRRFVQTALETARLQPNWIKKILRHKVAGEEGPYSQPKIEELRRAYRSALPYLDLSEKPMKSKEERRAELLSDLPEEFYELLAERKGMTVSEIKNLMQKRKTEEPTEKTPLENPMVKPKRKRKDCQRLITEDELPKFLDDGWKVVTALSSGKIVITDET